MGLFSDGISTIQDLMNQDSSILSTSQTENIDLTQKLAAAQQTLSIELTALLQRNSTYDWQFWLQPEPQLGHIVVTPPLQLWHVYQTLCLVYQDAYYSQLNDRYKGKRDQFQQQGKWAREKLLETGVGMTADPIPRSAAPQLTSIPGGQPAATYYASTAWLNAAGQEGEAGSPSCLTAGNATNLLVQPASRPPNATAWNVYVGFSGSTLVLQNTVPLKTDAIWIQGDPVSTTGQAPGTGQTPDYLQSFPRIMQRG